MGDYETLCEIVEKIELGSSCIETSDNVYCAAYSKGLFGCKIIAKTASGKEIKRINRDGLVVIGNLHQVVLFSENGIEYVADADSPEKVYEIEQYKVKCFPDSKDVIFLEMEES